MIALVDYGAGNLRSVEFALEHLGVTWRRAAEPAVLTDAAAVILPGVGAANSAMCRLEERGLDEALRLSAVPLLGICLGMQLLTERSEEGGNGEGGVPCLGLVRGCTRRLGDSCENLPLPLPHIGWNDTRLSGDPIFEGLDSTEHFYFLHAYRVSVPPANVIAEVDYGETFPAAVRSGIRVAVQFHPEKSGAAGLRILSNFCKAEGL